MFVPPQLFALFSKVYRKDHGRESLLLEYARYKMKKGRNQAPRVCMYDSERAKNLLQLAAT
jgi:predicted Ser/Thr protein kinase